MSFQIVPDRQITPDFEEESINVAYQFMNLSSYNERQIILDLGDELERMFVEITYLDGSIEDGLFNCCACELDSFLLGFPGKEIEFNQISNLKFYS